MYKKTTIFASLLALVALVIIIGVGMEINQLLIFEAKNNNQATNINRMLLNLSYSYITGYIVYMLTVFLPEKASVNKIKPVINYKFSKIENSIDNSIRYFCFLSGKQNIVKRISDEDLQNTKIDYDCIIKIQKDNLALLQIYLDEENSIIGSVIEQLIEYRDYLSSEGLRLLEEIRHSDFFGNIESIRSYCFMYDQDRASNIKYMFGLICSLREMIKKDKQKLF